MRSSRASTDSGAFSLSTCLGTDRDADGVPWALLASDRDGQLKFAGPGYIEFRARQDREKWGS